ncbi:hypothetical protein DWY99_08020 [[Clostridium] leptum]|uniref:Uncharacterized protein n=1 Tax=[Clostridium] leptum TaxID=1535 RepID=A0A412AX42_9FIRM|nr:hypothetical protein DWY99_08020 [[Clostridium] leptum]
MDRRKKQKEIFFTGFCVTLILAAALGAFLFVDNTLSAAGFGGGRFARSALSLWDHAEQWVGTVGGTIKIGAERIVNFLKHFFQQLGNLLHCVGSVL